MIRFERFELERPRLNSLYRYAYHMADSEEMTTMNVPARFKEWVKAHKGDIE